MARSPELKEKRNARIRKRYKELSDKKFKDKPLYRYEAILGMLEDEFCLASRTLEGILFG